MSGRTMNKSRLGALPWIAPALIMIAVFVIWPAFEMIRTSFQEVGMTGQSKGWAGWANYQTLLQNPDLKAVLIRTFVWVGCVVFFTMVISLPVAQLLNAQYPGRKVVRWSIIVPWAASLVMTSTAWKWILDAYYGVLNEIAIDLHLQKESIDWLADTKQSFIWLMVVAVFVSVPFTSFVILAGLSTVSEDIVEASTVDGATAWTAAQTLSLEDTDAAPVQIAAIASAQLTANAALSKNSAGVTLAAAYNKNTGLTKGKGIQMRLVL